MDCQKFINKGVKYATLALIAFSTNSCVTRQQIEPMNEQDVELVTIIAQEGFDLYRQWRKENPKEYTIWLSPTQGSSTYCVWTDGVVIRVDNNADGIYESIFSVKRMREGKLIEYVGTVDNDSIYTHTGPSYVSLHGRLWQGVYHFNSNNSHRAVQKDNKLQHFSFSPGLQMAAQRSFELYKVGKFTGEFQGGHYTRPSECIGMNCAWSDGKILRYDRDSNGHHETIFRVIGNDLEYIGSFSRKGKFVDVNAKYPDMLGQRYQALQIIPEAKVTSHSKKRNTQLPETISEANAIYKFDFSYRPELLAIAQRGYEAYKAGNYNGGLYLRTSDCGGITTEKCIWSDGETIIFDQDFNGHHETVFKVFHGEIVYMGSLGNTSKFIDVNPQYPELLGQLRSATSSIKSKKLSKPIN